MSAACALDTVPIITAASRNLRIANAPSDTSELEADHRSLSLTNRSRSASIGNLGETKPKNHFSARPRQTRNLHFNGFILRDASLCDAL
jgi:hypothetical protein